MELRLLMWCTLAFFSSCEISSAQASSSYVSPVESSQLLSAEERDQLVDYYAPKLVFHPDEQHFPCSPIFPLEVESDPGVSFQEKLGTPESRNAKYLALSLEEKARLAKVYYSTRDFRRGQEEGLIIDYWFYYVWNYYRVRGGLFPIWFDRSHPNDLEHIHFVLLRKPGTDCEVDTVVDRFRLQAVFSSAHEGSIPSNRLYPVSQELPANPHFLVERGAHASAPDANRDGLFTPGVDGRSGYKLHWGIRDKGLTWVRYNRSYTDPRSGEDAIVFSPRSRARPNDRSADLTYSLVASESLTERIAELDLTTKQLKRLFEVEMHLLNRAIGKSSGESKKLLHPPDFDTQDESVGLNGFSSTERGIILGITSLADSPGVFLGGRYGFLHGSKFLPDLIFQLDGILTTRKSGYLSPQFLLSYPISVSTKLMGGGGLLTDTIDFRNRQWDWVAGLEIRLGHLQVYGGFRSAGSVNDEMVDIRLAYFF